MNGRSIKEIKSVAAAMMKPSSVALTEERTEMMSVILLGIPGAMLTAKQTVEKSAALIKSRTGNPEDLLEIVALVILCSSKSPVHGCFIRIAPVH